MLYLNLSHESVINIPQFEAIIDRTNVPFMDAAFDYHNTVTSYYISLRTLIDIIQNGVVLHHEDRLWLFCVLDMRHNRGRTRERQPSGVLYELFFSTTSGRVNAVSLESVIGVANQILDGRLGE